MVELIYLYAMRHVLLVGLLVISFASCKSSEPQPADPFLGHWQTEGHNYVVYDAAGNVVDATKALLPGATWLTVTSTTLTFDTRTPGLAPAVTSYTRNGELLTFPTTTPGSSRAVRGLTSTAFTYEITNVRSDGSRFVMVEDYHR
jgi:hypothetical protein